LRFWLFADRRFRAVSGSSADCQRGGGLDPRHRQGKTVAAPGDCLDAAAVGLRIVQNPAEHGDLNIEITVFHRRLRPHRIHDLAPGDEIPCPLDQDT
jgi:hypothetical protein